MVDGATVKWVEGQRAGGAQGVVYLQGAFRAGKSGGQRGATDFKGGRDGAREEREG